MFQYSKEQLSTITALPIIVVLLTWTVGIFHRNRKKWGPYDLPIITILILSILRNLTILIYTLFVIFSEEDFNNECYCPAISFLFNSIHTFQASCLTSVAVIGLFSIKLQRKHRQLKSCLTSTHVIYHLFCLTTLCMCVGVAAILAQAKHSITWKNVFADTLDTNPCNFLPFELDIKFNVFILVLHVFLASVSLVSVLMICYNYCKIRTESFQYLKKSNSDLSELSNNYHGINMNANDSNSKHFYDTYTIHRDKTRQLEMHNKQFFGSNNNILNCKNSTWTNTANNNNNTTSNELLSATVSSTNSKRPCLMRNVNDEIEIDEVRMRSGDNLKSGNAHNNGLETMHPVLIVCYLFYHLPLIILCIYPKLIHPWPVAGIALWLGLVQDLLIPIGLGIVDSRFCKWVTNVYRCSAKKTEDKLPQVGLDGKFRPFGLASPPQTLEQMQSHQERTNSYTSVEHRFPITNGSLYTSIDGRLPVIHNYRRHHKDSRAGTRTNPHHHLQEIQSSNFALHSSALDRRESSNDRSRQNNCPNCTTDQCPSHSNLHHLTMTQYPKSQLQHRNSSQNNPITDSHRRLTQSEESIHTMFYNSNHNDRIYFGQSPHNHLQNFDNKQSKSKRLSRSHDSFDDPQIEQIINKEIRSKKLSQAEKHDRINLSSDDEDDQDQHVEITRRDFDSFSSNNSITTEANCDFEFFNTNEIRQQGNNKQSKITRSSSKRSLENYHAFVEENINIMGNVDQKNNVFLLQRSNSYTTLEDRKRRRQHSNKNGVGSGNLIFGDDSYENPTQIDVVNNSDKKRMRSVECLVNSNVSKVYFENMRNSNNNFLKASDSNNNFSSNKFVNNSVPDFKKFFISEYI